MTPAQVADRLRARFGEAAVVAVQDGLFDPTIELSAERLHEAALFLRDEDELLDREPALKRSIRLRNPYVDPMSLLQVDLLARWRATGRQDGELERALFETVRGIAQGLQNTG